ncbi:hypothetical protein QCA50_010589 [Cerrena zonata]|uniref:Uncharacterized protein n=1 Tax=Cerrena zonata TaxID=2478898 RepID=A0AAW0GBC0_9APHY
MYPYYRWSCKPPSRLRWFLLGAVSAIWWIKSKEARNYHLKAKFCSRHQIPPEAYPLPGCGRFGHTTDSGDEERGAHYDRYDQGWYWGSHPRSSPSNGAPSWDSWEDDRLRMMQFGHRANEKFTEFSEATLDTICNTVEFLKAKLAKHRAEHERQTKELRAMREEQMRQYAEWTKSRSSPGSPPSSESTRVQ